MKGHIKYYVMRNIGGFGDRQADLSSTRNEIRFMVNVTYLKRVKMIVIRNFRIFLYILCIIQCGVKMTTPYIRVIEGFLEIIFINIYLQ